MERILYNHIVNWKSLDSRMPLLLRGARQTGKTYLVKQIAKDHFKHFININFELAPNFKNCFTDLDPTRILQRINLLVQSPIIPGETLLFLDEIQECPEAITALRYFKEQMPELHIIGAGSLLEFVLNSKDFQMPVGRIEFMYLYPVTFMEFLGALNENKLQDYLKTISINDIIDQEVHHKLLELVRLYFTLGGMPDVINAYLQEKNFSRPRQIQANILNTYRSDFGKYFDVANPQYCQLVLEKAPSLIAKNFKYVDIDPTIQSRALKPAIKALTYAGIIKPIYATNASHLPLTIGVNEKNFKLLFLDIGLVNYATQINAEILLKPDFHLANRGAIAEQFVGQELLAYQPYYDQAKLYYWQRSKPNSSAEIDYLMPCHQSIIPIEVKAGKTGRLKSMQLFKKEKKEKIGIKISQDEFSISHGIISLPFYLVSQWKRLTQQML